MASADILRAARARIEDPKDWFQGWYAATAEGKSTGTKSADAVCWCAYGALICAGSHEKSPEAVILEKQARRLFRKDLIDTNDKAGHAAVLKVFDAAIAAAEAEAGR